MVFDRLGCGVSVNPAAEAIIGRLETDIVGLWSVELPVLEDLVTISDLVPDAAWVKCWEVKKCTHPECPSFQSDDLRCWLQCGTCCHNEIPGTFNEKRDACERCVVCRRNGIRITEVERGDRKYAFSISPIINQHGNEEGRTALFHDITDDRAAPDLLLDRNRELAVLNEVGAVLSQSLEELDVVLKRALSKLKTRITSVNHQLV